MKTLIKIFTTIFLIGKLTILTLLARPLNLTRLLLLPYGIMTIIRVMSNRDVEMIIKND